PTCTSTSERAPGGARGSPPEKNKDPAKADRAHRATPQVRERKRAHTGGHGGVVPPKRTRDRRGGRSPPTSEVRRATPQVRERKRAHTGGHGGSPPGKNKDPAKGPLGPEQ